MIKIIEEGKIPTMKKVYEQHFNIKVYYEAGLWIAESEEQKISKWDTDRLKAITKLIKCLGDFKVPATESEAM